MRILTAAVSACIASIVLVGCSSTDEPETPARQADSVVVREQWVKSADSGMTAVFAELQNTGGTEVRAVKASSPASTSTELHEMAAGTDGAMVMRPKAGGFLIPAGGTQLLGAGGDHLMLMDVTTPLTPGADAEVTVEFEDSSTVTFTAQVRDFAGAQEAYEPGMDMGMDMTPATPANGG